MFKLFKKKKNKKISKNYGLCLITVRFGVFGLILVSP